MALPKSATMIDEHIQDQFSVLIGPVVPIGLMWYLKTSKITRLVDLLNTIIWTICAAVFSVVIDLPNLVLMP